MKKTLVAIVLALGAREASAQETPDTFRLREVVVTATRFPQAIGNVPAAITVLREDELGRLGLRNVADVLRTVSGASLVQGGSYGALTSLFLRGGESDYVQVLLDGVQLNSPGELFDFSALSLENIERVEVVRGPTSVLYGSDAVTGVIQLFSKQGGAATAAHVTALAGRGARVGAGAVGDFGSYDLRAGVSGGTRRLGYAAAFSHFDTDGALAYNNQHRLSSGSLRLGTAHARSDAALSARVTRNRFHYPTDGSGNLIDDNQYHEADAFALGLDAGHRVSPRTELRAQLSWSRNQDHIDDAPDTSADTLGFYSFFSDEDFRRSSIDVRLNQAVGRGTMLTFGGEAEWQSREGSSLAGSSFGEFASASSNERRNQAVYAQLLGGFGPASLHGGLRIDHNEPFGDFVTYRAGGSLHLSRGLRLRGAVGTSFKEPRFFEQFSETVGARGNPALEPEQSRSAELGADLSVGRLGLGATLFAQSFRDLIQYTFAPVTADSVNYTNVGEVSADGLELEARFAHAALSLRAQLTLLDTEVVDAGAGNDPLYAQGQRLVRRPRRTASLAAHYGTDLNVGVVAHYVGRRDDLYYDESFTPQRVELPAYAKLDLHARTPAVRGMQGVLRIENVLDESYEEIRNFPARGRIVFVGLTFRH